MPDDVAGSSVKEEDAQSRRDATAWLVEVALPGFIILTFVALVILFVVIGPTAVLQWLLALMPKDPGLQHALILGGLIVVCLVLLIPIWPPLMIVTAMVFGFWYGLCICSCAMILGALISFLLGRYFLRDAVREYIENSDYARIRRMMHIVEEDGNSLKFMFLFRFLFLPIWIRNYVPSLFNISVWTFMLPVCVHSVWICAIFAGVGVATKDVAEAVAGGDQKKEEWDPQQLAIFGVATVSMVLISYLAYREYTKRLEEEDAAALVAHRGPMA